MCTGIQIKFLIDFADSRKNAVLISRIGYKAYYQENMFVENVHTAHQYFAVTLAAVCLHSFWRFNLWKIVGQVLKLGKIFCLFFICTITSYFIVPRIINDCRFCGYLIILISTFMRAYSLTLPDETVNFVTGQLHRYHNMLCMFVYSVSKTEI